MQMALVLKMREQNLAELLHKIDEDGFVVVREFFDPATVEQARRELDPVFDSNSTSNLHYPSHTLHLAVPSKSRTLDLMFEKILTDSTMRGLLHGIGGKNLKARDINARRMNGVQDEGDQFHHALEWHRDAPTEFGIGILLSDIEKGGPATGFICGSHKWFSDPRWHVLLGRPFYPKRTELGPWKPGLGILTRLNPFTRALWKKEIAPRVKAAYGKQGDFYVFLNQTWHNRMNNQLGAKAIVVLASIFPSEDRFSVGAVPWSEEVIHKVPPAFGTLLEGNLPPNPPADTVLARMRAARGKPRPFSQFGLAITERRVMNWISRLLEIPLYPVRALSDDIPRRAYHSLRGHPLFSSIVGRAYHFVRGRRPVA
jgi:hypothetical protein